MNRLVAFAAALALVFTGVVGTHAEARHRSAKLPDLTGSSVSAPASTSPGATIGTSTAVKNKGKATSSPFSVSYYLSKSPSNLSAAALLGVQNVASLPAGTSIALVTSLAIPPSAPTGSFYLVAFADSAKVVRESTETNNLASAPLQVLQLPSSSLPSSPLTDSPPISIDGQTGITIQGLRISSTSGPCIKITNSSSNIVVQDSDIGPCGGNAVEITDSSAIKVANSSIHTEHDGSKVGDSGLGVFVYNSAGILVQGNKFAYNESSVYVLNSQDIQVIGNYSVNPLGPVPRGQHVQFNQVQRGTISENYGIASGDTTVYTYPAHQEDAINVWSSAFIEVRANHLVGGDSPSGCGVIADGSGNANALVNNVVIRTAQCGVAIAGGTNHVIAGNKVLDTNIPSGSGNIGIYVWNQYSGPCSGHSVTGNDVSNLLPDGSYNNYWISGNCGPVTLLDNLGGSEARVLLTPETEKLPPPPIPPKPYVP